jgi:hypothetical protein
VGMRRTREMTEKILEMAESGVLDPMAALRAALAYMSEDEVQDLAHSEGWDEADDADEDDADEDDADEDDADEDDADEDEADEEAWHAYRWPTPAEIHSGRSEWDVVAVGCSPSEEGAIDLLPKKEGKPFGQIQRGKQGPVRNL